MDLGVTYGLRFFEDDPKDQANQLWMKVGAILDCTSDNAFDNLKDAVIDSMTDTATKGQKRIAEKNLDRLYKTI